MYSDRIYNRVRCLSGLCKKRKIALDIIKTQLIIKVDQMEEVYTLGRKNDYYKFTNLPQPIEKGYNMITAYVKPLEDIVNEAISGHSLERIEFRNNVAKHFYFKRGSVNITKEMPYGQKVQLELSDDPSYDYKELHTEIGGYSFMYKKEWLTDIQEEKKEMTVAEIEKELGYSVKIVDCFLNEVK